jgi:hypothetical protein
MRCTHSTIARLQIRLADKSLRTLLKPRETDGALMFTLQEAIIVARKPR